MAADMTGQDDASKTKESPGKRKGQKSAEEITQEIADENLGELIYEAVRFTLMMAKVPARCPDRGCRRTGRCRARRSEVDFTCKAGPMPLIVADHVVTICLFIAWIYAGAHRW